MISKQVRIKAVKRRLEEGVSIREIAEELGVADSTVGRWIKAYEEGSLREPLNIDAEEVERLRKENEELKIEVKVLKELLIELKRAN